MRPRELDAKMVIKDAFTLDVTVNPDFSQVESDEPQVTVNQRFEVYFPEKRPFFMENAGFFKTPQQLFFSRRIVDPLVGARLTGKQGKWSIGSLLVADSGPGEAIPEDDPMNGRHAFDAVVRVQRELKGNSNVALMATSMDFGSAHNRVLSADTRLQLLPNWILTGQAMSSDTRLPDGRRLNGPAYYLDWAHSGKHLVSETTYIDRSPSFVAGLGFINRVDIRDTQQTLGYKWRPEGSAVQSFGPVAGARINYDRLGRVQDWSVQPSFKMELSRMTQLEVGGGKASNSTPIKASANITAKSISRANGRSGCRSAEDGPRGRRSITTRPRDSVHSSAIRSKRAPDSRCVLPSTRASTRRTFTAGSRPWTAGRCSTTILPVRR